ncbi:hypothetical protein [Pseudokineococcus sp. 1T1Z-3]|uniref:hypothetical protein n=1 Tax=Pseudokineococcus sp. 1T1Z-3 TaxID=3132745 RepID=UPI0030AB3780
MSVTTVTEPLRAWARGAYDAQAGVELLIRYGPDGQVTGFGSGFLPPLHRWPGEGDR